MEKHYLSQISVQNPHATSGLTLDLCLYTNTDEEQINANIKSNSKRDLVWLSQQPANDLQDLCPVVIVGGGPSAADHLDDIKRLQEAGGYIIALNGASAWLKRLGIAANMQIIMDAQPETAELVDKQAGCHLFASQCSPATLDQVASPLLFHAGTVAIEDHLPPEKVKAGGYAILGGGIAVGNSAICAAYCLGFRTAHLFGFDCSNRDGKTHAYEQPQNADIPTCIVECGGQTYKSSVAMKVAADSFMKVIDDLEGLGFHIHMYGDGLLPAKFAARSEENKEDVEAEKYTKMWQVPAYRRYSPGEHYAAQIIVQLDMPLGASVLDLGCGPGRFTARLIDQGYEAQGYDIAPNCLDEGLGHKVPLHVGCLWDIPDDVDADYGVCCDVMEHIPTDKVEATLANIARTINKAVYFNISIVPDSFGRVIGEKLHQTVRPATWWDHALARHWPHVLCVGGSRNDVQFICKP